MGNVDEKFNAAEKFPPTKSLPSTGPIACLTKPLVF